MTTTREQILVELNRAAQGPLGRRSLAMTLRKSHALLLGLREDGITWHQIAELLAETGHNASGETIRRTFTRIKFERKDRPALVAAKGHAGLIVEDIAASSPARILTQTSIAERATGPPGSPTAASFKTTPRLSESNAGASLLDALRVLKELDR